MSLSVIGTELASERLNAWLGVGAFSVEGLSDLLRAEVHSRSRVLRVSALERVRRQLGPLGDPDEELLAATSKALVQQGDLVLVPGGYLAATPLRIVPLPTGGARLFSSLPTPDLSSLLDSAVERSRTSRSSDLPPAQLTRVEALGARVVTPEAWAGLDRSPAANASFLGRLEQRLTWEAASAGSLEREGPLEWRGWLPHEEHSGWRTDAPGAQLWMARVAHRGRRYAWTSGDGSPSTSSFVELRADDADRARFALARVAASSPSIGISRSDDVTFVEIPTWLPRPEYRWMTLHAASVGGAGSVSRWRFAAEASDAVLAMLRERLGLESR